MADNFYLSGLDDGWFSNCFEPFHLFGYVGDRDRLQKYAATKSFLRSVVEIVLPTVNVSSILQEISGFGLLSSKSDGSVAKQIIDLVNETENRRRLTEFAALVHKRCRRSGRYFDAVAKRLNRRYALHSAHLNAISDELITVEAQLLHRTAVEQYEPSLTQQLAHTDAEWLLADFPPHAMSQRNPRFSGHVLLLKADPGFADTFAEYLPFSRRFAWYPYCRVAGFFDSSRMQTEVFPTLSLSLIEYRRPKLLNAIDDHVFDLLTSEMRNRIYLKDWSDLLLAAYLLPLVTWGSNLRTFPIPAAHRQVVTQFNSLCGTDMPRGLASWYAARLPLASH